MTDTEIIVVIKELYYYDDDEEGNSGAVPIYCGCGFDGVVDCDIDRVSLYGSCTECDVQFSVTF